MAPEGEGRTALQTDAAYSSLFGYLGIGSAAVGVVLATLIPFLRRLIGDGKRAPAGERLAVAASQ
jgi:hypothetical protein